MPQMKPMNWLILFILFNLILISKTMLNFFNINYNYNKKNNLTKLTNKYLNWKW